MQFSSTEAEHQPFVPISRTLGYVSEIDGLRAIAVLAVLIYHIDFTTLSGGFTGVDVFFVISGYVIARSLANAKYDGFFDYLMGFYKRRFIRLIPALLLCLLLTALVSTLLIPSSWLSSANQSTGFAAFFGFSNFALVWTADGYFSPRTEFNPFVHTWSLAVEEQFYLVFPLIIFAWLNRNSWNATARFLFSRLLMVIAIVSLIYSGIETPANPTKAYYLLPSRFWELAAGALLFQYHSTAPDFWFRRSSSVASISILLGAGIITAGFFYSDPAAFPFPWAIPAVLGTVLVINGVADGPVVPTRAGAPFRSGTLTYLGRTSYSLYLWHWPVYTLFRWTVGLETVLNITFTVLITFALALLSYHWVELPARKNSRVLKSHNWQAVLTSIALVLISAAVAQHFFDSQSTLSLSVTRDQEIWSPYRNSSSVKMDIPKKINVANRKLFVVGDSHAGAYRTMLSEAEAALEIEIEKFNRGGCAVASLLEPTAGSPACEAFIQDAFKKIQNESSDGDIVFLASLRMKRLGDQWANFPQDQIEYNTNSDTAKKNRLLALNESMKLISELTDSGLTVLIDAPKPVFRSPPFRCIDWYTRSNPVCTTGFEIEKEFLLEHREPVMESLAALESANSNLSVWDPFSLLCGSLSCSAFDGDKPLFFDGDHLSGHGNRVLAPAFITHLLKIWAK